nr:hypothetical transcript [Hymenolepis microstoma]
MIIQGQSQHRIDDQHERQHRIDDQHERRTSKVMSQPHDLPTMSGFGSDLSKDVSFVSGGSILTSFFEQCSQYLCLNFNRHYLQSLTSPRFRQPPFKLHNFHFYGIISLKFAIFRRAKMSDLDLLYHGPPHALSHTFTQWSDKELIICIFRP